MNRVLLTGRLTADPDVRWTQGNNSMAVAHATLAVDRNRADANGNREADFIRIVVFGNRAEWMEKYTHKGMKLEVCGRWQTGSYTDNNGNKVYTNDCVCDEVNFGESKNASSGGSSQGNYQNNGYQNQGYQNQGYQNAGQNNNRSQGGYQNSQGSQVGYPNAQQQSMFGRGTDADGFMSIPDNVDDEGLPFN